LVDRSRLYMQRVLTPRASATVVRAYTPGRHHSTITTGPLTSGGSQYGFGDGPRVSWDPTAASLARSQLRHFGDVRAIRRGSSR
jgi:hypothetical protein